MVVGAVRLNCPALNADVNLSVGCHSHLRSFVAAGVLARKPRAARLSGSKGRALSVAVLANQPPEAAAFKDQWECGACAPLC